MPEQKHQNFNVIVVGAGPAGVRIGVALNDAGVENFVIVDRHGVGASFDRCPAETRFITPSFPTNSIGMLDLNSIASTELIEKCERPSILKSALNLNWSGQMIACGCWILSVFSYGISSSGDALQLLATTAWMISNVAASWETHKEVA